MSCSGRFFALAIRRTPKQLSTISSHATTPINCFLSKSFDSGALCVRSSSRWVHTRMQPDETMKKTGTKEKNGGEVERRKIEEQRMKSLQELRKVMALEHEMEGLEKVENEVTEKLVKEIAYFDKLGGGWVQKINGLKTRHEMEKEFQEKLKRERENWERLQKELTESLDRLKAYDVLENKREEVKRKMGMKKDERDNAIKLLISSYQDVLVSSPPTP